jgi:RNA polymerase sigma-70 factor, ECF subfamily
VTHTDDDFISALRTASADAQQAALSELRRVLRGALARSFGQQLGASDLDDLTQESLLRVHQRLDTFEKQCRFTTWATAIAVHAALSELRRRRYKHVELEDAVAEGHASLQDEPRGAPEDEFRLSCLRQGIHDALTERQREATLAKLSGLPLMEIARRLDTTQGAVYKLLHDARLRLKDYLETNERSDNVPALARGAL